MKICFISADRGISMLKHNGASAHVRSLVQTFKTLGQDVFLLTPSSGGEDLGVPIFRVPCPQILDALLNENSEKERKRMAHALGHIWNNVMVEGSLQKIVAEILPDLLFEVYSPYGIAAGILARKLGIRHILNVHAPLAWEGMQFRQQALQEAAEDLEKIAFESAQMIVTNSEEMRQQLIAAGVGSEKIVTVPNGVDIELFGKNGNAHRENLDGKIVIGFVGSLKAWHGIDELIAAFRQVATNPRLHLLVVGDGPMAKPLRRLSDAFPGRITMTGAIPLESVPAYIRAMDITVAPYPRMDRFYFSPLKVLEYMASGKAVVASNIGQISQMITDGLTGILVPPGDISALANAIDKLAADENLRQELGNQAAKEAELKHTWSQRALEIIQIAEGLSLP